MLANRQLRLHAFVMVAFVYQMNVCPCGNLEHNGWYQLAKLCLQPQAIVSASQHSTNGASNGSEAPLDCDSNELTYVVDVRVNVESLKVTARMCSLKSTEHTDPTTSALSSIDFLLDALKTPLAPELRAELQVFLL